MEKSIEVHTHPEQNGPGTTLDVNSCYILILYPTSTYPMKSSSCEHKINH